MKSAFYDHDGNNNCYTNNHFFYLRIILNPEISLRSSTESLFIFVNVCNLCVIYLFIYCNLHLILCQYANREINLPAHTVSVTECVLQYTYSIYNEQRYRQTEGAPIG